MARTEQATPTQRTRAKRAAEGTDEHGLRFERGIREIESGVYRVRVNTGVRDALSGSPKQLERIVRGGIRDARRERNELEGKARVGRTGGESMTVAELLDTWLAACAKRLGREGRDGLELSTYNSYELQVRTLKATRLASTRLEQLTTRHPIEETYEALEVVIGVARRVQVHKALRCAFNYAMGEGWMTLNPAALVKSRPPEPKSQRATPTVKQIDKAFAIARRLDPDLDIYIATGALAGFRRQAICGLQWPDIEFESKSIFARRFVNVIGGQPVVVGYAKHRRGKPPLPPKYLDDALEAMFRELLERQRRRAELSHTTLPTDGWLFSLDGMGLEMPQPEYWGKRVSKLMGLVDLDATLHSLRHHRASKLMSEGVDPAIAARELDHASLSYFLNTYVHPVRSTVDPKLAAVGKEYAIGESKAKRNSRRRKTGGDKPTQSSAA